VGRVAGMGEMRNDYKIFVEKPEGKRSRGRPRRRWEDYNIRMKLRNTEWERGDWMHLAQVTDQWRALLNTVMIVLVA